MGVGVGEERRRGCDASCLSFVLPRAKFLLFPLLRLGTYLALHREGGLELQRLLHFHGVYEISFPLRRGTEVTYMYITK